MTIPLLGPVYEVWPKTDQGTCREGRGELAGAASGSVFKRANLFGTLPGQFKGARALSPRSFLLLEHSLQPTPSPLCGLASWPLLGACSMYPGENSWLDSTEHLANNGRVPYGQHTKHRAREGILAGL